MKTTLLGIGAATVALGISTLVGAAPAQAAGWNALWGNNGAANCKVYLSTGTPTARNPQQVLSIVCSTWMPSKKMWVRSNGAKLNTYRSGPWITRVNVGENVRHTIVVADQRFACYNAGCH